MDVFPPGKYVHTDMIQIHTSPFTKGYDLFQGNLMGKENALYIFIKVLNDIRSTKGGCVTCICHTDRNMVILKWISLVYLPYGISFIDKS